MNMHMTSLRSINRNKNPKPKYNKKTQRIGGEYKKSNNHLHPLILYL